MPIDRSRYPFDWDVISYKIRSERAGWRCEWCGAKHGVMHPVTGSMVVLTVAHLGVDKADGTPGDKNDKMDCRPDNLAALCQRCHLNYDRFDNIEIRQLREQLKRAMERERAGQLQLFSLESGYE